MAMYDRRAAATPNLTSTHTALERMHSALDAFEKACKAFEKSGDPKSFKALETAWGKVRSTFSNKLEQTFLGQADKYDPNR